MRSEHTLPVAQSLGQAEDLVPRLRSAIQQVAHTCECRDHVDEAIARFMALEQARQDRRRIGEARKQLARIVTLTDMLAELDEISWNEVDRSAFDELAQLFDEVGRAAALGSSAMQMVSQEAPDL